MYSTVIDRFCGTRKQVAAIGGSNVPGLTGVIGYEAREENNGRRTTVR